MNTEERRGLWENLSLLQDWLEGGIKRGRDEPDWTSLPVARAPALRTDAKTRSSLVPGDSLVTVEAEVAVCVSCRLASGRSRTVFGQGAARPEVLVVGEGPGEAEDAQGRPFVGPAGRLLDKMLSSIGLSRETNCYITNVVKCRPPGNRDPEGDEVEACSGYLRRQIALLKPQVILCVGRVASQALLGTKETIGRLRGRWFQFEGIPLLATYHPSALLREESLKRPAWEDLKKLRDGIARERGVQERPPAGTVDGGIR